MNVVIFSLSLTTFGIGHQHDVVLSGLEVLQSLQVVLGAHDARVQDAFVSVELLLVTELLCHLHPGLHLGVEGVSVHPDSEQSEKETLLLLTEGQE